MSESNENEPILGLPSGGVLTITDPGESMGIAQAEWGEVVCIGQTSTGSISITRPLNDVAQNRIGIINTMLLAMHDRIAALEAKIAELEAQP